jgi:hypothetical protein
MAMPEMTYVDSTNVEAIGYDEVAQELYVQFLGSGMYVYYDVPQEVYDELINAPSKGRFLNEAIKNVYQFTRQ